MQQVLCSVHKESRKLRRCAMNTYTRCSYLLPDEGTPESLQSLPVLQSAGKPLKRVSCIPMEGPCSARSADLQSLRCVRKHMGLVQECG